MAAVLHGAEAEARRRGDDTVAPDHLGLALTHWKGEVHDLLATVGVDPVEWRDEIVTVLA